VLVAGSPGAGKSTLARRIATRHDLRYVEMDALFHGPGWTERPTFQADVAEAVAGDTWVIDSLGYASVRDLVWEHADTLVWLDLPRRAEMWRVVRRTVRRAALRIELWNGNREPLGAWRDRDHPIWLAWHEHEARRDLVEERLADPRWAHLEVHRLRSARQVRTWRAEHLGR